MVNDDNRGRLITGVVMVSSCRWWICLYSRKTRIFMCIIYDAVGKEAHVIPVARMVSIRDGTNRL